MELKKFWEIFVKNKWLFAILFIASALRLYGLEGMGLGVDEALTILQAKDFSQIFYLAKTVEFSPPLYYFIAFAIFQALKSIFFLRLFSALMGIILVFLMYALAKETFGKETAMIAAFLAAISPSLVAYSHLMRNYEFFFVLIFLAIIFTKRYSGERKGLAQLAISNALLLLATYLGFLILAAECLVLKLSGAKNRAIAGLIGFAVIFLLTVMAILMKKTQDYNAIFSERYFFQFGRIATDFAYMAYKFAGGGLTIKTVLSLSPLLFIAVPIMLFAFAKGAWPEKGKITALHYFMAVPAAIAFALSLIGSPIFHYKYSSYLLPMFIIFAANGFAKIENPRLKGLAIIAVAACWIASVAFFYYASASNGWNAFLGV